MSDEPFYGVFGNTSELKVLNYLIKNIKNSVNPVFGVSDLARVLKISWSTANKVVMKFLRFGILIKAYEKNSKFILYAVNMNSDILKAILEIDRTLDSKYEIISPPEEIMRALGISSKKK